MCSLAVARLPSSLGVDKIRLLTMDVLHGQSTNRHSSFTTRELHSQPPTQDFQLLAASGHRCLPSLRLSTFDRARVRWSELLYDWRFSPIRFVLAPILLRLTTRAYFFLFFCVQINPCIKSSLMRVWVVFYEDDWSLSNVHIAYTSCY
jgi:hypothetical protein